MKLPKVWLQHRVTVEPYEGNSAYGEVYGAAVVVPCWLEKRVRLVRARDGREVTSTSTFYCRLDAVDAPPESRVTLSDGRTTTVIEAVEGNAGALPLPEHLEVRLV